MIKHVVKYQYITGENPIAKNGCTILEFPHVRDKSHNSMWVTLQQKLLDCHIMLRNKFPTFNFGVPDLISIDEVKIINHETTV